jgi:hypothetical protein
MRAKNFVLSMIATAAASLLLLQAVPLTSAFATDLTVRVTQVDGRSTSKPTGDVADGGTGGFKSGTHTMDSSGHDGIDVATDVPLNTTHRGLTNDPHATVSDSHPPTATEAFSGTNTFGYLEFFNGTILETVDVDIVEAGGTVSLELQAEGGGDLTLNFSDGHHDFDSTDPVASVALANGTDTVPVRNWVYILQSSDVLTASAVGWPDAEHAPIATVVVQSAASVATDGPYKVQVWTDHIKDSNDQGHQTDIADWIRGQHATWKSGVSPTLTIETGPEPDTVIFTSTLGEVYQLHPHDFPAFTGTPDIYVFNEPGTPYNVITDINQLTQDSEGNAFTNNDYFTITIWAVVSEDAADCKLFLNLPSGIYGNSTAALLDSSMFTNTSIPAIYKGAAFLIAKYVLKFQTAGSGTFSLVADGEIDLRGQPPGTSTGGGAGGGSSLTVEEQDSSPSVPDVNTIKFPNGAVIDDGGGIVSINTGATQLSDLSDVGVTTPTDGNVLRADGDSWESAILAHSDITAGDGSDHSNVATNTIHISSVGDDHSYVKKSNFAAGAAPTVNDDVDEGYVVGSYWHDTTNDESYVCLDNTDGAAVWVETTAGAAGGETNTGSNQGTDGVGVFDTKAGVDLQFRNLAPASAHITINLNGKDIDAGLDFTQAYDYSGGSIWLEFNEGNAVLASAGQVAVDGVDDAIAIHFGAGGEIQGEGQVSGIITFIVSLDPGQQFLSNTYISLGWIGDEAPNGIIIDEWRCECNVDPDVEILLDMYFADNKIGLANATLMDVLDTTNGTSSEDTDANINGGAALANGKFWYLLWGGDPEGTCDDFTIQIWLHPEED